MFGVKIRVFLINYLEKGPLIFSKGDLYKTFTKPFQLKMSPFLKASFSVGGAQGTKFSFRAIEYCYSSEC